MSFDHLFNALWPVNFGIASGCTHKDFDQLTSV
jgi:hypothetical protein